MDYATVQRRHHALSLALIIGLVVWFTGTAVPAHAQDGACPPGTLLLGSAAGWYPAGLSACSLSAVDASILNDHHDVVACDQYLYVRDKFFEFGTPFSVNRSIFFVPPATQDLGGTSRVRFLLWFYNSEQILYVPPPIHKTYRLEYYNTAKVLTDVVEGDIADETIVTAQLDYIGYSLTRYYNVYLFEATLDTVADGWQNDGIGGYFRFTFTDEEEKDYTIASLQIANADEALPPHCAIPGANLPSQPTPTLGPGTPTPTATSTPPYPTAVPATLQPTPTLTPISYGTIPAPPPPTQMPVPTGASITFPNVQWPTLAPIVVNTPEATIIAQSATRETEYHELEAQAGYVLTRWAEPIDKAFGTLNTTITSTAGISTTQESAVILAERIGYPFRFFKSLKFYLPSTWPFFLTLFAAVTLVIGIYVFKVALALISLVINLIKSAWEAIPLN